MSDRITITVPDGLGALVEGLAEKSGTTGEVPTLSKAKAFRLLAYSGGDDLVSGEFDIHSKAMKEEVDADDLLELVPDHLRAKYLRDEVKRSNWLADMRGGFEGRVRDALAKRFENGYDPEAARDVAEGYIDEARIYWLILDDDEETFEEKRDYVLDRVEDFAEKHETTTWDFEEDFLGSYEGVEEGRTEEELIAVGGEIRAIAEDRLGESHGRDEVVDSLDLVYDEVGREAIEEIVDDVRRESVIEDQIRASDHERDALPEGAEFVDGAVNRGDAQEVSKSNGAAASLEGETND